MAEDRDISGKRSSVTQQKKERRKKRVDGLYRDPLCTLSSDPRATVPVDAQIERAGNAPVHPDDQGNFPSYGLQPKPGGCDDQ